MKVLVDIPDNKIPIGLKVLCSLTIVKWVKPVSVAIIQIWQHLKEATDQVIEYKKGTKKLKTAQALLIEL